MPVIALEKADDVGKGNKTMQNMQNMQNTQNTQKNTQKYVITLLCMHTHPLLYAHTPFQYSKYAE